ncbi:hypothetical protein [Luteibacter sp. E-22]|uniref:hypothetical protein n=1 Tax=Luteibacter sp. E-22 TaxID=3404050 RepID=UPI003CEC3F84
MTRAWLVLALTVIASVASATDVRVGPQGPGFYRMRMGGDEVASAAGRHAKTSDRLVLIDTGAGKRAGDGYQWVPVNYDRTPRT